MDVQVPVTSTHTRTYLLGIWLVLNKRWPDKRSNESGWDKENRAEPRVHEGKNLQRHVDKTCMQDVQTGHVDWQWKKEKTWWRITVTIIIYLASHSYGVMMMIMTMLLKYHEIIISFFSNYISVRFKNIWKKIKHWCYFILWISCHTELTKMTEMLTRMFHGPDSEVSTTFFAPENSK